MSATRDSRQQPATVRLEQRVKPKDGNGKEYFINHKRGMNFGRVFNPKWFREGADDTNYYGPAILEDGNTVVYVDGDNTYRKPKRGQEEEAAQELFKKYHSENKYKPQQHYEHRDKLIRENQWIPKQKSERGAVIPPPAQQPQHKPPHGHHAAPTAVASGPVHKGGHVPPQPRQGNFVPAPVPAENAWNKKKPNMQPPAAQLQNAQSNLGMPRQSESTPPAPQRSVNAQPVNTPVIIGFNKYVIFPDLFHFNIVKNVEFAQYCAKSIEKMAHSLTENKINEHYKINMHTKLANLAKKLYSDYKNSFKEFQNKSNDLEYPVLLKLLNDFDETKVRKGIFSYLEGDDTNVDVNQHLANFYDQVYENLSEIKQDFTARSIELEAKFKYLISFFYDILHSINELMQKNHNLKLQLNVQKSCIQSMDSLSGRVTTSHDAHIFTVSAEAYYQFRKTLHPIVQYNSVLRNEDHVIMYFVYLLMRANADKKKNFISALYNLVLEGIIDIGYFGAACANTNLFISAFQQYASENTPRFIIEM